MLSVGVDVGTTRTKAIAIDAAGDTRAVVGVRTPWSSGEGLPALGPEALLSTVE
jgi:sugar (pentulose or hexulose) kinase